MNSDPAEDLHDDALFQEIRLLGALVLAASGATRPLTTHEVDAVLEADDAVPGLPAADSGGSATGHR